MADDIPEILDELRKRNDRIRFLEGEMKAAQRLPEQIHELMRKVESCAKEKLNDLRTVLAKDREGTREVIKILFPDGLKFNPVEYEKRKVFAISGNAKVSLPKLISDPTGT